MERTPQKLPENGGENTGMSYFSDDITFCPLNCDNMDCIRNSKNIQDRTIPHSYSIELPDDCPNKIRFVRTDETDDNLTKFN